VSISDHLGGAEKMARDLFERYRARGFSTWLAVAYKTGTDPDVMLMPNEFHGKWYLRWYSFWRWMKTRVMRQVVHQRSAWRLRALEPWLFDLAEPGRWWDRYWGLTDYRFPGTWYLLCMTPETPNVIHCHNLHNWYFNLHALPWLSHQVPVILSLHDA